MTVILLYLIKRLHHTDIYVIYYDKILYISASLKASEYWLNVNALLEIVVDCCKIINIDIFPWCNPALHWMFWYPSHYGEKNQRHIFFFFSYGRIAARKIELCRRNLERRGLLVDRCTPAPHLTAISYPISIIPN